VSLLWDDEEGARPFEDDYELAPHRITFNPMKEGDPWSGTRNGAPCSAAGTTSTAPTSTSATDIRPE
jgi:hypothetical protein